MLQQAIEILKALEAEMLNLSVGFCCSCEAGMPLCYGCQQRARLQCWRNTLDTALADLGNAGWLPIESAPAEIGSRVLVWCPENIPGEQLMLAERREHGWVIDIDGQTLHPTLWQPLPPDPAE